MDAVLVVLLAVFVSSEANPSTPNRTCTESGIDCVFPFVFGGKQYNSCIAGSLGAWCGIKAEVITSTRNVDFSYCLKKCPIKKTECTTEGYKCIWPYIDENGHNHTSCVHYHSWFGSYYWCPIVSNYTGGPLHGKCADSCPADGPKVYTTAPKSTAATTNPGTTTTPTAPTPKTITLPTTSRPTTAPTATASKTTTLPTTPAPTASAPKSVTTTSPPTAAPTVAFLKPAATPASSTRTSATSRNPKIVVPTVKEEPTVKTPEPAAVPSSVSTSLTSSTQTPVPTTSSTIIVSAAGSTSLKPDTSSEAVQPPASSQAANGRSAVNDAAPKLAEGDFTEEGTQSTTVAAVPGKSNATILLVCLTVLFALVLVVTLVYLLLRKRRQRKEKAKAGAANKEKVIPLVEQHSLPNGKSHEAEKIAAEPSGDSGAPLVVDESSPDKVRYVTTDSGFGSRGNFAET